MRKPRGESSKGIEGRFWEKAIPEPNTGCWLWNGALNLQGYGNLYVRGTNRQAHRVAYELYVGAIPPGLELDHLCRMPCCVNPSHLEPVTHQVNMRRGLPNRGVFQRSKTHCRSGHPYMPENTYHRADGSRECRTCTQKRCREHQRKVRARRK